MLKFMLGVLVGMVWVIVAVMLSIIPCHAVEPHSHEDEAGKFYARWTRPDDRSKSCCNQEDCRTAEFKNVNGTWFFREGEQWRVIPERLIEQNTPDPRTNPNGQNHICASPGPHGVVYCAILGGGL